MKKSSHRWWAWVALLALVFAQLGVSVYACPAVVSMSASSTAPAGAFDQDSPTLCEKHCNGDQQSGPHAVPAAAYVPSFVTALQPVHRVRFSAVAPAQLRHATSPPSTISYCCWRI